MDIQQPPLGADLKSPEMHRFLQDTYNGIKNPNCFAYMASNINCDGTWQTLPLNRTAFNNLGPWDTGTYRFTPKVPGYYSYVFRLHFQLFAHVNTGNPFYIAVQKTYNSGGAVAYDTLDRWYVTAGTGLFDIVSMHCHGLVYLNGTDDYLTCLMNNQLITPATDIIAIGDSYYTYFKAHKITY